MKDGNNCCSDMRGRNNIRIKRIPDRTSEESWNDV
jgi:hypothetical protein